MEQVLATLATPLNQPIGEKVSIQQDAETGAFEIDEDGNIVQNEGGGGSTVMWILLAVGGVILLFGFFVIVKSCC